MEEVIAQISAYGLNPTVFTWDLLVVVGMFALALLYAFTKGDQEVISLLISVYIAGFIISFSPHVFLLNDRVAIDPWMGKVLVFFILFLAAFLVLRRNGFFEPYVVPTGYEIATFTVIAVGLFVSTASRLAGPDVMEGFSSIIQILFYSNIAFSVWAAAPLVALLALRGET